MDDFTPQPYPLECSTATGTWMLVIGWRIDPTGQPQPLVAWPEGGLSALSDPSDQLRFRLADTRPNAGRAAPAVASTGTPARRERSPRTE